MTVEPDPHEVRRLVIQIFGELGAAMPTLFDLEETILMDDGKYAARSYRVQDNMAMWLLGVGIVQFYDAEGNMLATVNLFQDLEPKKMAAGSEEEKWHCALSNLRRDAGKLNHEEQVGKCGRSNSQVRKRAQLYRSSASGSKTPKTTARFCLLPAIGIGFCWPLR